MRGMGHTHASWASSRTRKWSADCERADCAGGAHSYELRERYDPGHDSSPCHTISAARGHVFRHSPMAYATSLSTSLSVRENPVRRLRNPMHMHTAMLMSQSVPTESSASACHLRVFDSSDARVGSLISPTARVILRLIPASASSQQPRDSTLLCVMRQILKLK